MNTIVGTGVALITPFRDDLKVDHEALRNIVEFNIDNGTDYLVIMGTTAENATLSNEEKQQVINTVINANKRRLPLVLGIGGNNTAEIVETIQTSDLSAFQAILSVSPYYNRPTQEGIYQHFKTIAEATSKPIILYNVPSRTSSNINPVTVIRLAKDCKNIVAIKEAAGDIVQAMTLINGLPSDFHVISGDDMLALPMVLAGGSGVISVLGQGFPKEFSTMINLGLKDEAKDAYAIHYKLTEIINLVFEEGNPAGIKAVFEFLNLSSGEVRLPLVKASNSLKNKIEAYMKAHKS